MKRYFERGGQTSKKTSPTNMVLSKRVKLDGFNQDSNNNNNNNRLQNNNNNNNKRQRSPNYSLGNNNNSNNTYNVSPTTSRPHLNSSSNSNSNTGAKCNSALKDLSMAIWNYYRDNAQTEECYKKKLELKDALDYIFRGIFKYIGIYIVGSSSNGFGTNESDVDICLMISREEINQKTEAIHFLKLLSKALRRTGFIQNLYLISAKVPIIKFHDSVNDIDCDLNVNNHIGIRNTHLLKCYSELDWRATPLVLIIKKWAKHHEINDAARQTISSYNLTLMAIYYMQAVCKPPVLPILHRTNPEIFNVQKDITKLNLLSSCTNWSSANTQSLGELFIGFLDYYAKFPFEEFVISIRLGDLIPRDNLRAADVDGQYSQWKYLLIEEPFELINAARSVYNGSTFEKIIHVFQKSASVIKQTKSLDSLFREKYYVDDYNDYYPTYNNNNNNNNNYNNSYHNNYNRNYNHHNNNYGGYRGDRH